MVLPNLPNMISSFLKKASSTKKVFPWNSFNITNTKNSTLMIHYGDTKLIKASDFLLAGLSFRNPFSGRLVRVPYSRKFCFVLTEKAEIVFHMREKIFRTTEQGLKLLHSLAPQVTLTESVAKKILDAMSEGLMLDKGYKINGEMNETCFKIKEDIKQSRLTWKPETKHLNGKEWEIYVAERILCLGLCGPSGKIIISATLLHEQQSAKTNEAVVATIFAHELGHAVAKHGSRTTCKLRFVNFLLLWCEAEADYIGLMLMASAGYDPRVAPLVYQHFCKYKSGLFSTHYTGDKRAELLNRDEVMKEALKIYEDAKAGNGVESFV